MFVGFIKSMFVSTKLFLFTRRSLLLAGTKFSDFTKIIFELASTNFSVSLKFINYAEHDKYLREVLTRLEKAGMTLKLCRCVLFIAIMMSLLNSLKLVPANNSNSKAVRLLCTLGQFMEH